MASSVFGMVLTGSVGVGLCVSCAALAGSGRVNFSGAVVEPTCRVPVVENLAQLPPDGGMRRMACAEPGGPEAHSARTYVQQLTPLPVAPASLLPASYAGRVEEGAGPAPMLQLLTRTYE